MAIVNGNVTRFVYGSAKTVLTNTHPHIHTHASQVKLRLCVLVFAVKSYARTSGNRACNISICIQFAAECIRKQLNTHMRTWKHVHTYICSIEIF